MNKKTICMSISNKQTKPTIACLIKKYRCANTLKSRFSSFDYCYGYFQRTSPEGIIKDLEKSCLVLGFYLASWGMMRGSSFLLEAGLKHYEPLIKFIAEEKSNQTRWKIDIDDYNNAQKIEDLLHIYERVRSLFVQYPSPSDKKNPPTHLTMATKVMLGVWGNIPAFDRNFKAGMKGVISDCGFSVVNKSTLAKIFNFYELNRDVFSQQVEGLNFDSNEKKWYYPKVKLLDMFGFEYGKMLTASSDDLNTEGLVE